MTTYELRRSIDFIKTGYGHWKVTYTSLNGRVKSGTTTDSIAIDRINSDLPETSRGGYGYTLKQALLALKRVCN